MKKLFLVFLILGSQNLHAQNRDSLLRVANSGRSDTNTVKAMRALAGLSDAAKTREAIAYGFRGAAVGKALNWAKAKIARRLRYQYSNDNSNGNLIL